MWGDDLGLRPSKVRNISLLADERVVEMLSERDGLVSDPQHKGPLLALTDRRLLLFAERDGQKETTIVPLEQIRGVTVRTSGRSMKPLIQGLALMVAALVAYLLIGTFVVKGVLIPAIVGTTIGTIGIYMMLRYIFWEDEASLTFRADGWSFSFPQRGSQHADTLALVHRLFELKATAPPVGTQRRRAARFPAAAPLAEGEGLSSPAQREVGTSPGESLGTPEDAREGPETPAG